MADESLMIDVKGLQTTLGVGRDVAYSLMRSRAFPSMKIGNRYLVNREALMLWIKKYEGKEFVL